jgi:ribonuclease P protein component
MSVRFGPAVRLRSREDFTAVQRHGRRVGSRYLTVLGRPNALGRDRLGLIASRKLGGAVVRNRAKRRLREVFRRQQPSRARDARQPGWDVVIIPRADAVTAPFADLQSDLTAALQRLQRARTPIA